MGIVIQENRYVVESSTQYYVITIIGIQYPTYSQVWRHTSYEIDVLDRDVGRYIISGKGLQIHSP